MPHLDAAVTNVDPPDSPPATLAELESADAESTAHTSNQDPAYLETSSDADDITIVATTILQAITDGDVDELAQWADYPMPNFPVKTFDAASLSCAVEAQRCNLTINGGESVTMGFEYSDRGWSGWSFVFDERLATAPTAAGFGGSVSAGIVIGLLLQSWRAVPRCQTR